MGGNPLEPKESLREEILSEGYARRARVRVARRKSPWNLVLIPLVLAGVAGAFFGLARLMWEVHILIHPADAGGLSALLKSRMGGATFLSFFLLFLPLFLAALPLGMLAANAVAWCIPPARRTFEQEARGHRHASFRESMGGLARFGAALVPVCLLLSLLGAYTLKIPV